MLVSRATSFGIVNGRTTCVLQASRPSVEIGKSYPIQEKPQRPGAKPDPPVATIKITKIDVMKRGALTEELATKAGWANLGTYKQRHIRRYKTWDEKADVWIVMFDVISVENGAFV